LEFYFIFTVIRRESDDFYLVSYQMESLTGKLRTAQPDTADLPEKINRSKTPSPQKICEGSVKTETIPEPNSSSKDGPLTLECKGEGTKETVSASSEVLNADSPRTSNDSGALLPLENINTTYPHMVDSSIIHMSDNLCAQMLSPQACQRISVKLEEGSFQDDSCNYTLTQLDEERGLPWWDWP